MVKPNWFKTDNQTLQLALLNAILNICFNYTTKQNYNLINFGEGKQFLLTSHEFGSECGISGYKLQTGDIVHHSFNAPNTFKLQKCIGKLGQTSLAEFFQNFEQRCQPSEHQKLRQPFFGAAFKFCDQTRVCFERRDLHKFDKKLRFDFIQVVQVNMAVLMIWFPQRSCICQFLPFL